MYCNDLYKSWCLFHRCFAYMACDTMATFAEAVGRPHITAATKLTPPIKSHSMLINVKTFFPQKTRTNFTLWEEGTQCCKIQEHNGYAMPQKHGPAHGSDIWERDMRGYSVKELCSLCEELGLAQFCYTGSLSGTVLLCLILFWRSSAMTYRRIVPNVPSGMYGFLSGAALLP